MKGMRIRALVGVAILCFSCTSKLGDIRESAMPAEEPAVAGPAEPAEFVVTAEVYSRTFEEIEEFIRALNQIIRDADFESWQANLSEEYIRIVGDPAFLREQSEKPLLLQSNIELRDLRDYFVHVVVPSRTQAQLDEIEFIDENHVKALSVVRGTRVILYLLDRQDGSWKIGIW